MVPTATTTGLLTHRAKLSAGKVAIDLDVREHAFLRDHVVGGRPLLSTVMGIECMACAVALVRSGAAVQTLTGLRVLPPYLLPENGDHRTATGRVEITLRAGDGLARGLVCTSTNPDAPREIPRVHFSAELAGPEPLRTPGFRTIPPPQPGHTSIDARTLYALFFHGPSFQVLATAYYADGLMVGVLHRELEPAVHPPSPSIMAPLLIELCLQTAGLWELAVLDRMTIPDRIERVTRFTDTDVHDGIPLVALVSPRRDADGRVSFDAQVVDPGGVVHLEVRGYRTIDFDHPVDEAAAAAVRAALDGIPALP